ncbi:MAG: hypothetical protein EXR98_11450 [Gemmataceae bacterium]|nr:hypothetical protein [Gemmataceae bacterium]
MSEFDTANAPPPSPRQVLLGCFILFHLTFMIAANLLGYAIWVPNRTSDEPRKILKQAAPDFAGNTGHGWEWSTQLETNIRRWTQLTLQDQEWALFTSAAKGTGFPCVILVWDDVDPSEPLPPGTKYTYDEKNGIHLDATWNPPSDAEPPLRVELLLSRNEPKDVDSFVRISNCRVRRYEGPLFINLQPYDGEEYGTLAARISSSLHTQVKDYHDQHLAYMRWRLKEWTDAHPHEPAPKQILLFQRFYRIHKPDEERGWQRALYPIARWLPDGPKTGYVLDYFDYRDRQFLPAK